MTDKVQKIREEVEKRFEQIKNSIRESDSGAFYQLKELLEFIDSLHEEPAPKVFEDMLNAKTAAASLGISQEEHDRIVDECIYGKEPELVDVDDLPNKEEEPVSEDLGEYINDLSKQFPEVSFAKLSRIAVRVAKWQKEKEYTCYEEAFEDGSKWKKEQMMAKAIDATCFGIQGDALFSFRLPADSYLVGSKVKVIIIKEN